MYVLFVLKHTVWYKFVVQWINTYSTRGKIIWSCIFQPCDLVRHFPGLAFSRSCIFSRPERFSNVFVSRYCFCC